MKATHLRTEYLKNPIGIDITTPRFSWHCEGGKKQSAYQIIVKREGNIIWDSGKVVSSKMHLISYEGEPLVSRDVLTWSVRLWDEKDVCEEEISTTETAVFEIGLLQKSDWKAQWMKGDYEPKKNARYPADYFKKEFAVEKEVKKARLYATAMGYYEAAIDGRRVGDYVLAPGSTDYNKRIQYQTYDVTEYFEEKRKYSLSFILGDGWYRGSIGCFGKTNVFGRETKLLAQLEITYLDGTTDVIGTDDSFAWSNDGPIRFNDFKDGEIVDANRTPSYSGNAKLTEVQVVPSASNNVWIKEKETFKGKLITTPSGKKVVDFGQNLAGFISFRVKGEKGQKIKLTLGEVLDANGEFTQDNMVMKKPVNEYDTNTELLLMMGALDQIQGELQVTPRQVVEFVCSGGEDIYKTKFALFGFQRALVEGDVDPETMEFESIAVYSDMEQTGEFHCSKDLINQLYSNILWSMRSNYIDLPMDCPTRERLGWTGDAQIFFRSGSYLYNVAPFFAKWIKDLGDDQNEDGLIPAVVPLNGIDMMYNTAGASVGWQDAGILIPYRYYKEYGDRDILEKNYEICAKTAEYMIENIGPVEETAYPDVPHREFLYEKGMQLGEWLEPAEFRDDASGIGKVLHPEEATAYMYYSMNIMAEIATVLGKTEDAKRYQRYADGAKAAYQELFLQSVPRTNRQAKLVRPLALGLVEPEMEQEMGDQLVRALDYFKHCVGTGFLSTVFLLPTLTRLGHVTDAYQLLENEQMPGWLYQVKQGAT
ncbi:MAG: family 78 glycoside hydrolase catalytic domain, partial [Clostridiales bacterium]|nr:family 78 glycoside hydrolase catalytic domain [Clostridiales bacterium]